MPQSTQNTLLGGDALHVIGEAGRWRRSSSGCRHCASSRSDTRWSPGARRPSAPPARPRVPEYRHGPDAGRRRQRKWRSPFAAAARCRMAWCTLPPALAVTAICTQATTMAIRAKQNCPQGVTARQGRQQQRQAEGVKQQGVTGTSRKCRNLGRCRFQDAMSARCGALVCQSSRVSQPKRACPSGGGCEQAAFPGKIAGVPGGISAECGQRAVDVVENQRQGAEREGKHRDRHPARRHHADNLSGKDDQQATIRCRRSSMSPMLYPTSPDPAGSIPRRAGVGCAPGKTERGATCRRRSAGAATPPGPNRSRWSADKVNPPRAIRIQTGRRVSRRFCAGVDRRARRWLRPRAAWGRAWRIPRCRIAGISGR